MAIHRGDDRDLAIQHGPEGTLKNLMLMAPGGIGHALAFLEVAARTKGTPAGCGQDDAADIAGLRDQRRPDRVQITPHLRVEGVGNLWPIEADDLDMRFRAFELQGLGFGQGHVYSPNSSGGDCVRRPPLSAPYFRIPAGRARTGIEGDPPWPRKTCKSY